MRERAFWAALVLVLAVLASQAYLSRAEAQSTASADPFQSLLQPGRDPFRAFFGDDGPFAEMRDLQRRLLPLMQQPFGAPGFALPDGDLDTSVAERGGQVIVTVKAPREKDASVSVTLKDGLIRASCDVERKGSSRHMERLLSVPPQADPATGRIENGSGEVRIVFARRHGARRTKAPPAQNESPADDLERGPSA